MLLVPLAAVLAQATAPPASEPAHSRTTDPDRASVPAFRTRTDVVALGDLDADGRADHVVAGGQHGDRVLRGRAGGGADDVTVGSGLERRAGSLALALFDVDEDDRLDLLRLDPRGCLEIERGLGDAVFAPGEAVFDATVQLVQVVVADVDGDGRADLVGTAPRGTRHVALRGAGGALRVLSTRETASLATSAGGAGDPEGPRGPSAGVAAGLFDTVTGVCTFASNTPRAGYLYPLTQALNVDPSGQVGIGTTTPEARLHVVGDALTVDGGALEIRQAGTAAVRAEVQDGGGALRLLDATGATTLELRAADAPGAAGSLKLSAPLGGDFAVVDGGVGPSSATHGRVKLGAAGQDRVVLQGRNDAAVDYAQVELWNDLGFSTVRLHGSHGVGDGRLVLASASGVTGAELASDVDGQLQLREPGGNVTVGVYGGGLEGEGLLELATPSGDVTASLQANAEGSGAGRVELGAEEVGTKLFLDGGSGGAGPEIQLLHSTSGGPGARLTTNSDEGGGALELFDGGAARTLILGVSPHGSSGARAGYLRMDDSDWTPSTKAFELGQVEGSPDTYGMRVFGPSGNPQILVEASDDKPALVLFSASGTQETSIGPGTLNIFDAGGGPSLSWGSSSGKSAIVDTSRGPRRIYVREGAEAWFEDAGVARTEQGRARVELDPLFLETVTINDEEPLTVFVTAHADVQLRVDVDASGFSVTSDRGDARFSWLVQATRAGFEGLRLEPEHETDPTDENQAAGGR